MPAHVALSVVDEETPREEDQYDMVWFNWWEDW